MIKKVLEYQRRKNMIKDGDRIVVGFSGGADSVCLLLMLAELREYVDFSYCAVHVEHGIRGEESLRDAAFTEEFCKNREIPFYVYHVDAPGLALKEGMSLEEAARKLRYDCFELAREAFEGNKVAVAHHGDDNAETMLFHMARGTGLKGLCGIPAERGMIIRPLLGVTRSEIEEYLKERQEAYCTDSTNCQIEYSRNRIRANVIPQLETLNVRAVEHMSALAEQLTDVYGYLAETAWFAGREGLSVVFTDEDGTITEILRCGDEASAQSFIEPIEKYMRKLCPNWCIDKAVMAQMHPVLQREFLHQVLGMAAGSRKDIGAVHVENLRQMFFAETGKQTNLPYGLIGVSRYQDVCVKRTDQDIVTCSGQDLKVYTKCFDFDGDCKKIPEKTYTKWFDYDKIKNTVSLRNRIQGDYLVVNQQGNQKKLKEYLINEKIPREDRDRLMLLADGSHIMWVIGHRISEAYKVTRETKRILEVRVEKESLDEREDSRDVF